MPKTAGRGASMTEPSNTDADQAPAAQADGATEDTQMEIHKPKPVHSWREFLTEIGVVVIGVAIALAGEQTVEALHNHSSAADARASVREEIARNLSNMNYREATETCMTTRLDEVQGLISDSAAGRLSPEALWIGHPIAPSPVDGKYKMATQSGAASLFNGEEQAAYAELYGQFAEYSQSMG
jgi:hypothetical protein